MTRAPTRFGGSAPGWAAKILLLGGADALAVAGLITSISNEAWGYATVLGITLVALNVVYLPKRFVPAKYLLPGVFFLSIFALYPVIFTVVTSTTNYGTGHVLSRSQAIEQIQSQSVRAAEGATKFDVTPMAGPDGVFAGFALIDPDTGDLYLGTTDSLDQLDGASASVTTLATTGRGFVESVDGPDGPLTGVRAGQVRSLPGYPDLDTFTMPGLTEDAPLSITGAQAVENTTTRIYDSDTGTITDSVTGVVYHEREGLFVADDGNSLSPGFKASVGFDNYREVLTSPKFRGPLLRVLGWNFTFAIASVVITFAFGLFLASVFNEAKMKSRRLYRSLLIIPYALPGFMTALVWRGMFNQTYGINRWLPFDVAWQSSAWWARASLILVNLWLGYPYMFLVSTGALQSIPSELREAALVDGATGFKAFRKVTFPLLLVSVSPLLVASFAFNFNNFTIIYLVTSGGPRDVSETAGRTDILLSWVYRLALDTNPQLQGLAAALSAVIFLLVAVLSAIGFKYTKAYEEVR